AWVRGFGAVFRFSFSSKLKNPAYWASVGMIVGAVLFFTNLETIVRYFVDRQGETVIGIGGTPADVQAVLSLAGDPEMQAMLERMHVRLQATFGPAAEGGKAGRAPDAAGGRGPEAALEPAKAAGEAGVASGALDAYVEVRLYPSGRMTGTVLTKTGTNASLNERVTDVFQALQRRLAAERLGLGPEMVSALVDPPPFTYRTLQGGEEDAREQMGLAIGMTYVMVLLLYLFIVGGAGSLVMELIREKSSRFIELVLPSVSPLAYMWAKILAMLGVFVVQYAAAGLILYGVSRRGTVTLFGDSFDLSKMPLDLLGYALLLFVLGYLFYAAIFAAVGSMIARVEEANTATTPVTLLFVLAFIIAMWALRMPDASFVRVLSWLPPFTPLLLFVRIALGSVAGWEIAGIVGLLALSAAALLAFAGRLFRRMILSYEPWSWRRFWQAMRGEASV
ncbi:ABC transporter permease, partial [Hydrogenibacillus schlegelii]